MSDGDGQADLERPVVPEGRYVTLPGRGTTFVREIPGPAGAPTVVLLHGWTATADLNWWASYAPLGSYFRVIALDHRGHGRGIQATGPFRLEDCADDVAVLVRQLGLRKVVPVGYSMGGPVAQLLWRRHPELVAGLVLCATSASFVGSVRERLLAGVATGTSAVAGAVPIGRLTTLALGKWTGWRDRRDPSWWGFEDVARHDWTQIIEAGRETLRFDSRGWLGDIDVPTSVVITEGDLVVPSDRQRALARAIPDAQTWSVRGGHPVCTTNPTLFVPSLIAACRAAASARSSVAA